MKTSDQLFNGNEFSKRGDPYRVAYLMAGYLRDTLTDKEHDELDEWVGASDDNMRLFEELTDERNIEAIVQKMQKLHPGEAYDDLKARLGLRKEKSRFTKNLWMRVAASVAVLIGLVFLYNTWIKPRKPHVIITGDATNDIQPGGNHATLTLSNGNIINLDSSAIGVINQQAEGGMLKLADGAIAYNAASVKIAPVTVYNTLTTPNGGQHKVVLQDGTVVWLNTSSSLKYPVAFSTDSRNVELNGEAYFEVAASYLRDGKTKKPFVVICKGIKVQVLGTHFNVSAYPSDEASSTTLMEGKVAVWPVNNKRGITYLQPGEQAVYNAKKISVNKNVDTASVVAWKNGQFIFRDADIKTIMRQVERWYNAKVVFEADITGHFNATVQRDVPVSKLLHYLELTKHVYFTINNNTITVKNKP